MQALLNLLLTGTASPNVFNGTLYCGEDGRPLKCPLQGVLSRSDVGYLHWSREQVERGRLPQVESLIQQILKLVKISLTDRPHEQHVDQAASSLRQDEALLPLNGLFY